MLCFGRWVSTKPQSFSQTLKIFKCEIVHYGQLQHYGHYGQLQSMDFLPLRE